MTCKRCKGWKVVRGAGSRAGQPYRTKHGAETALVPVPCPECAVFVPHEWDQSNRALALTCVLCGVVVHSAEAVRTVQSCTGAPAERITALRDENLRANGVLIEGVEWERGSSRA
jgi:hypothetical protein